MKNTELILTAENGEEVLLNGSVTTYSAPQNSTLGSLKPQRNQEMETQLLKENCLIDSLGKC